MIAKYTLNIHSSIFRSELYIHGTCFLLPFSRSVLFNEQPKFERL